VPREKFTIELDREEALMMVFLDSSTEISSSRVAHAVGSIASVIRENEPSLHMEQVKLWDNNGRPKFDLSAGPGVEA
jgi:predicted transcriptional regulator